MIGNIQHEPEENENQLPENWMSRDYDQTIPNIKPATDPEGKDYLPAIFTVAFAVIVAVVVRWLVGGGS